MTLHLQAVLWSHISILMLRTSQYIIPKVFYVRVLCYYTEEVNVRVLGKGLELLSADGGRFIINQLLFADDTTLVADSEEKLCRLVSEFGRVCKKKVESECR